MRPCVIRRPPQAPGPCRRAELPAFERLGDTRSATLTWGQIADIVDQGGDSNEALRIRREIQLPVFERLGDTRSTAITQGHIADFLRAARRLRVDRRCGRLPRGCGRGVAQTADIPLKQPARRVGPLIGRVVRPDTVPRPRHVRTSRLTALGDGGD
jgi:hypothetical protein